MGSEGNREFKNSSEVSTLGKSVNGDVFLKTQMEWDFGGRW